MGNASSAECFECGMRSAECGMGSAESRSFSGRAGEGAECGKIYFAQQNPKLNIQNSKSIPHSALRIPHSLRFLADKKN